MEYEKIELYGVDIIDLYDFNLEKSYYFVNKNTNYLEDISIDKVKDIKFSYYKDIVILYKNGDLYLNGKMVYGNIELIHFLNGMDIYAISKDKVIYNILNSYDRLNNDNYKYKKVLVHVLSVVALTYDNDLKVVAPPTGVFIDYKKYYDVDDIGYIEENDDIVIIKDNDVYSLFEDNTYSSDVDIMLDGNSNDVTIIS